MKMLITFAVGCVLLLQASVVHAEKWALQGTLLTPESAIENGMLVIDNEKVDNVGRDISPPIGAKMIPISGIVLPGFIDLHNHLTWNVFPRWRPARKFSNRYEWQELPEYDRLLRTPQARLIADGLGCDADLYAELKAIAGGATSVIGSFGLSNSAEGTTCINGLARNLDLRPDFPPYPTGPVACSGNSLGFPSNAVGVVANEVFPLETPHERFTYYECELNNGRLRAVLVHLAEGGSTDASARREFMMLKGQNLLMNGLIIIHGTALTLPDFQDMRANNVGLIWSPRSNDELYGGTVNIPAAMQAGVTIAIAPDWSPTGSAGMLQELNYAARKYPYMKPEHLVAMATSIPAKLARIDDKVGKLANGLYADIVVIRPHGESPYEAVVRATPADILLVMIAGRPIYGDYEVMKKMVAEKDLKQWMVCGASKAINFGGVASSWEDIRARLETALHRYGTTLSSVECN